MLANVPSLLRRLTGRTGRVVAAVAALACAGGAAALSYGESGAGVLKLRVGGDARQTRVVIELTQAVSGKLLAGAEPGARVVVALPHVNVSGDMSGAGAGLVKAWAIDQAAGAARVKLDVSDGARVKRRFLLPPDDGFPAYRYVIDLTGEPERASPAAGVVTPAARVRPIEIGLQPPTPSRKVIVIDAGHGGHDPGAHGAEEREKTLTLAAARALRDRLQASGRYTVVLTRETDVYIPLEQRVQIARRANADLFISLHADSGTDPSIRGATVYTLSQKGADRVARHVVEGGVDWFMQVNLPGGDPAVNRILLDLSQRDARNRSATFAELLLERIGERVTLLRRSHRDAGFMVLLAPDVPAVLLEMGFITNREDERVLSDPERRRRFMDAAASAIDAYFTEEAKLASR